MLSITRTDSESALAPLKLAAGTNRTKLSAFISTDCASEEAPIAAQVVPLSLENSQTPSVAASAKLAETASPPKLSPSLSVNTASVLTRTPAGLVASSATEILPFAPTGESFSFWRVIVPVNRLLSLATPVVPVLLGPLDWPPSLSFIL